MILILSLIYISFYFSSNLLNKIKFFFLFYFFTILFFFFINKNIFSFLLLLVNASALLIFIIFILLSVNLKLHKFLKIPSIFLFWYLKFTYLYFHYVFYFKLEYSSENFFSTVDMGCNIIYSLSDLQKLGYLMYFFYFI